MNAYTPSVDHEYSDFLPIGMVLKLGKKLKGNRSSKRNSAQDRIDKQNKAAARLIERNKAEQNESDKKKNTVIIIVIVAIVLFGLFFLIRK